MAEAIRIQLLDRGLGHPIQVWDFIDREVISIGRAKEADVRVADPQVSREHARLQCREGTWHIESLGRSGVYVCGESVHGVPLEEATILHLGANGPAVEFVGRVSGDETDEATQSFDADSLANLFIDTAARDTEVRQVVESPFFQQVRKQAAEFREDAGSAGAGDAEEG